jgi:dolichol-phosphate mannosyltransferase
MLVVVVLGAIQMFVLGMIGEYIGRLYTQAKNRPLYIVQNIAGGSVNKATLGIDASGSDSRLPAGLRSISPAAVHPESGDRG